jgi:hypothetical protein
VRNEFDLSASDNLITPSLPIAFSVLSENDMYQRVLPLKSSEMRDVFNLSTLDNLIAPFVPILLPVCL